VTFIRALFVGLNEIFIGMFHIGMFHIGMFHIGMFHIAEKLFDKIWYVISLHNVAEQYTAGADKSSIRPGRKQASVCVRMASISFGALPCKKKILNDSSRLDVFEIARVPDMFPSFFLPGQAKDLPAPRYSFVNIDSLKAAMCVRA